MIDLWAVADPMRWRDALERYEHVVSEQGVARLPELDRWYRESLPHAIGSRRPAFIMLPELVRLTEWKMARGVWRARNLVLVRGNEPEVVVERSTDALAKMPHPTAPIASLATLQGVGPATASAIVAATAPDLYPFLDELVAGQVPGLGGIAWTLSYYARYAAALRHRAEQLGRGWTPLMVERALWAHAGGKAGAA
ncbi:MAG TPA: hypothetical protein VF041_11480 [Gemmatimonadaceae bacterium]